MSKTNILDISLYNSKIVQLFFSKKTNKLRKTQKSSFLSCAREQKLSAQIMIIWLR